MYKYRWVIETYFPFIDAAHFITCTHKQLIRGDILVDDGPHNFGGSYIPILFDAVHNRNYKTKYRAHNWQEVYNIIQQLLDSGVV